MYEVGQPPERVGVRAGKHTVPQIEHVAQPATGVREHLQCLPFHHVPRGKQHGGIEVPLDGGVRTDSLPRSNRSTLGSPPDDSQAGAGWDTSRRASRDAGEPDTGADHARP